MAQRSRSTGIGIDGSALPSEWSGILGPMAGMRQPAKEPIAAAPQLERLAVLSRKEEKGAVPRVLFEDEIPEVLGEGLHKCSKHSGEDPTAQTLYSYNPLTGEVICYRCHDFYEAYSALNRKQ